jgi:hypothetical protein
MLTMFATMAQFEREVMPERRRIGIDRHCQGPRPKFDTEIGNRQRMPRQPRCGAEGAESPREDSEREIQRDLI